MGAKSVVGEFWRHVKICWHKFFDTGYSEIIGWQNLNGKFRVKYPDGKLSTKMAYSTAKAYSSMFGGEVVYYKEVDVG